MMPLHIRIFATPAQAEEHIAILASLPASFAVITAGQKPDIALVGPDDASIARGLAASPKALVLLDPWSVAEPEALLASAIPIYPVLHLAPMLTQLDISQVDPVSLIRSAFASRRPMAATLFEHLSALQLLFGPLTDIALLSRNAFAYAGTARTKAGIEMLLSGQAAVPSDRFELDVLGLAQRLEVIATLDASARPAEITLGTAAGLLQTRGIYESAPRLFWRHLAADLTGGPKTPQLRDLVGLLGIGAAPLGR